MSLDLSACPDVVYSTPGDIGLMLTQIAIFMFGVGFVLGVATSNWFLRWKEE